MPTVTANDGDIKTWDDSLKQEVWSPPSVVSVGDTASYKGESSPTATEFSYLHLVTGPIQSQINGRAPLASPALTGAPTVNGVAFGTAAFKNTGTASGEIPLLGAGGKLPSSTLPALAITDTFVVASQAAMLALSAAETGDVAVRSDLNKSFILRGSNPAVLADWQELLTPTDAVLSVNGQTGVVVLTTQHIGEHSSNLYHTPARVNTLIAAQVGVTVQAYDAGLAALAAFNTNGLLVQTADNTFAGRTLAAPAAGLTITNPAGTAGNPTFAFANDLAALEGLGSTGIAVRTAADTWAQRSVVVTASTGLAVTNGDGVAGNITLAGVDASTTVKGVASFNSTNFSVASGAVNTIQNINTAAAPTFGGLTIASAARPTLVIDTTGTTGKGRVHTPLGNFVALTQNAAYSGTWNLDDTTLSGWQVNLDSRSGSDAFTVARMSAGANPRTPTDLLKVAGDGLITFNNAIRSTSYTSGLVGWNVSAAGDAEFANVTVRGAIRSSVLLYNAVLATNGSQITVKAAAKLRTAFTVPAGPTYGTTTVNIEVVDQDGLSHAASQLFAAGDYLYVKDGINGYTIFKVSSASDQTTFWRYACTIEAGTANVTYNAGLGVLDYGASGGAGIILTADQGNAPYMQMFTHAGVTAQNSGGTFSVTPLLRLGNLNGSYGYSSNVYGLAAGQYNTTQAWFTLENTSGLRMGSGTTARIQLNPNGSGYLANSSISWDTSGNLTVAGNASIAGWTVNTSTITGTNATLASSGRLTLGSGSDVLIIDGTDATYRMYVGSTIPGVAGFRVHKDGSVVIGSATIVAATIGIQSGAIGGGVVVQGIGAALYTGDVTGILAGNGWILDYNNGGAPRVRVGTVSAGALTKGWYWDGSDLTIPAVTGNVNFDSGTLYVDATNNRVGVGTSSPTAGFVLDVNTFARVRSGLVIGAELGGYVISGNHRLQVIATGSQSIAMFQGGSGAVEIWKDTTPTKAAAFGMAVPGNTITDDFIFSTFSNAAPPYWFERMRITNAGALKLAAYGAGTLRTDSSGNVTAAAAVSVTGSRGGNAALASLLTQLASLGIIVDNTTA